jgi:hypothetical protein
MDIDYMDVIKETGAVSVESDVKFNEVALELINSVWAKSITHFRSVKGHSHGALVYCTVIRDVGE